MEAVLSDLDEYLKAFGLTLLLFVVSGAASLVLGLLLAALRVGPVAVMRRAAAVYVTMFRNTPLLMIFVFTMAAMPKLGVNLLFVEEIRIAGWNPSAFFTRAALALTLYTAAFVCEALRSGINAVPLGQAEAARSIGLTFTQSMRLVVLPQAGRAVIPPLTSVQVALLKNTSVAAAFGMAEAAYYMRSTLNNHADQRPGIFLMVAVGYVVLVELVTLSSYALERRSKVA